MSCISPRCPKTLAADSCCLRRTTVRIMRLVSDETCLTMAAVLLFVCVCACLLACLFFYLCALACVRACVHVWHRKLFVHQLNVADGNNSRESLCPVLLCGALKGSSCICITDLAKSKLKHYTDF